MLYCPNFAKSIRATDEKQNVLIARTRCKMWSCEYCAKINRRLWQARIMNQVKSDDTKNWYFWTITLKPSDHTTLAHSLSVWRESWDKVMKTLKRKLGKFQYLRVFEQHKSGVLHVHMLCNASFDDVTKIREKNKDGTQNTRYNSEQFKEILLKYKLGIIHDIRPIKEQHDNGSKHALVASYVTKYLTKDMQSDIRDLLRSAGMSRIRLIQTSQAWAKIETDNAKYEWTVGDVSYMEALSVWTDDKNIYDVQLSTQLESTDFEHAEHYPNKYTHLIHLAENEQESESGK